MSIEKTDAKNIIHIDGLFRVKQITAIIGTVGPTSISADNPTS